MAQPSASQQPNGSQNRIANVAIVGAGGRVGTFIAHSLLATGIHTVSALTRPDSKAVLPSGVLAKHVDYSSHASLVTALRGQDFLIITLSVFAPKDTSSKLIAAARDAGVSWVMPNEWGTSVDNEDVGRDTTLGPGLCATRREIVDAAMNFVALSCGFWYEFSLAGTEARYGFDLAKREITFYGEGGTRITTTTWVQCGRAVAALLSLPVVPEGEGDGQLTLSAFRNGAAFVGSFFVSQRDMLASVLRVTGTEESDWKIKHEDVKERYHRGMELLKQGEFRGFGVALYARLFYPDGSGDAQEKLVNGELGLPQESLDEATRAAVEMFEGESDLLMN